MTPEEIINKQTWEILQDIKEESLAPEEDGTFFYETTKTVIVAGENSPTRERKTAIVKKLAREEKAIEIIKEIDPDWRGTRSGFYLKLLQPRFSNIYEKYQKACDINSYLEAVQERELKGNKNHPKLYNIDEETQTQEAPIKHKGRMFETGSGGGYYNRNHPIRPTKKQSANEIVDGFSSSNYTFVLTVLEEIASLSEFSSDGTVHYQLQSPPGQLLIQERMLLTKLETIGLFRNAGEDGIHGIATLRDVNTEKIKQVITEINKRQSNLQTKPEDKNTDLEVRYDQLIEEIRKPKEPAQDIEKRYDKIVNEIKSDSKKTTDSLPTKRELKKKITSIIQARKFGKKEKAFLRFLAKDFEPKTIEEITIEVSTDACKNLKASVQNKIKNTEFRIKTIRADRWGGKSKYQLKYLPTPKSP